MKYRDYYETLGVARDASPEKIKSAYRRLARKYHPDVSKESDAEDRFKEVGEAYDVLRDSEKRASYDQLGQNYRSGQDFRPPPGWESTFRNSSQSKQSRGDPFSHFFEDLFRTQQREAQPRGAAAETLSISIELHEAFAGAEKQIRVTDHGTGDARTLKFKVPKGVLDGQKVRLSGQGAQAANGRRGDLILVLNVRPDALYKVEGADVYLDLPIAPWEAALGATIKVPTLAGPVDLRIPAGSRSGGKLRLKGRGLGREPGNQYCVLQIVVPPAQTEQARALYERMAEELDFNPRQAWTQS
jgi:curved DNA-binding protein